MAEWKYDLALVKTLTDKKIREQAWYKERLKTTFLKTKKPGDVSKTLQGSRWQFFLHGLDDFRDGLPPRVTDSIIVKGTKEEIEPNIHGDTAVKYPNPRSVNRHRFTEEEVAYLRSLPLQQQRRDHINEMEYGLLQHPLALYPHLEESMPPDVFEDVVEILDPEMNLDSEDGDEFDKTLGSESQEGTEPAEDFNRPLSGSSQGSSGENKLRNPYRWLPRKDEQQKDDRNNKTSRRRSESPAQDEHIKNVTKEFCDWVSGLGGDSNNVEESTIHSLFASGYETKPALSVPIHVVELTNVPPELRMSATVSQEEMPTQTLEQVEMTQKELYGGYQPSWFKMKYGAWYLPPKTWSRRRIDEPLEDPQAVKDKEMSESKKKSLGMDEQLAPLHGSKSFKEFVEKKGTRMPEFLQRVAEFQAQAEAEELAAARSERGRDSSREIEAK